MKQYCRYCAHAIECDAGVYCGAKDEVMSDESAKRINSCKKFDFLCIDVFDLDRKYHPRKARTSDGNQINMEELK